MESSLDLYYLQASLTQLSLERSATREPNTPEDRHWEFNKILERYTLGDDAGGTEDTVATLIDALFGLTNWNSQLGVPNVIEDGLRRGQWRVLHPVDHVLRLRLKTEEQRDRQRQVLESLVLPSIIAAPFDANFRASEPWAKSFLQRAVEDLNVSACQQFIQAGAIVDEATRSTIEHMKQFRAINKIALAAIEELFERPLR